MGMVAIKEVACLDEFEFYLFVLVHLLCVWSEGFVVVSLEPSFSVDGLVLDSSVVGLSFSPSFGSSLWATV